VELYVDAWINLTLMVLVGEANIVCPDT
jgi:hypothetical protein